MASSQPKLKVLQLCLRVPFPERDGGTMAMSALANGLQRLGHEVHTLALNTSKHYVDLETLPIALKEQFHLQAVDVDNRITPVGVIANLLTRQAYQVSRFVNEAFARKLKCLLDETQFDLVVFESIFMAPYLDMVKSKGVAHVLRSHNVEFTVWERIVAQTTNPLKRMYLQLQKNRLEKFERTATARFTHIAAISPVDQATYEQWKLKGQVFYVPFGVDVSKEKRSTSTHDSLKMGFLGTMSWIPNSEGIFWFVKQIWPELSRQFDHLHCTIAGYEMPERLMEMSTENLKIQGPVESSEDFVASQDIVIAPLLSGGGVRIKILEAMSLGVVVMATPIGQEGIPARNGEEVMTFSNAQEAVDHLQKVFSDKEYLSKIANGGKDLVSEAFDKQKAAQMLLDSIFSGH